MNAINKRFGSDHLFPIEVVYQDSKTEQRELPFHFHDWYELVYVYKGMGTFLIDQSIDSMESGNVFLIPRNTIHQAIPDQSNPVLSTAVFFDSNLLHTRLLGDSYHFLSLFDESSRLRSYKYHLHLDQCKQMEHYLQNIHTEFTQEQVGYRHAIVSELQMMLVFLRRQLITSPLKGRSVGNVGPAWITDVLTEIDQKYKNHISQEHLAQNCNISAAHLSRVFKKTTGLTISEYVVTKRIVEAKKLLAETDKKVVLIANDCGFESMPYFYRTFKRYTGQTPDSYRKSNFIQLN